MHTFPLLNYHYIVCDYSSVTEQIEKLNNKLKLSYSEDIIQQLSRLYLKLSGLNLVKANASCVTQFLQVQFKSRFKKDILYKTSEHLFNGLPHINVERSSGNSIGISRFLLLNLNEEIIVVTKRVSNYLRGTNKIPNTNIRFITPDKFKYTRGLSYSFIILEETSSNEFINDVLPHVPEHLVKNRRFVKVGDNV